MNIEDLSNELENLKKEVWYLIKKTIPKLQNLISGNNTEEIENIKNQLTSALEEIDNLSGEIEQNSLNITDMSNSITEIESSFQQLSNTVNGISQNLNSISSSVANNTNNLTSISNMVEEIDNKADNNTSSISTLSASISSLSESVDALQTELESAKKEKVELIYDMYSDDPEINWGYTSGAKGNSYFIMDFTKYHSLRVFARMFLAGAIVEMKVKDRKLTDLTMVGANAIPSTICYLKIMLSLEPYYNKFQVSGYGKYDFTGNNSFTMETGLSNDLFYVYRIEGIIK